MARTREAISADNPAPESNDKRKRRRLTVYLNNDGTPDWEGVTDEQRTQLGLAGPSAAPEAPPMNVPPEVIGYLVLTLTRIEAAVIAPKMGLDSERVLGVLTPAPPLLDGISEAGAKVLAKYGGTMGKYQEEIVLGMLLIQWQAGAIGQLRAMSAEQNRFEPVPISTEQRGSVEQPTPIKPNFGALQAARRKAAAAAAAVANAAQTGLDAMKPSDDLGGLAIATDSIGE